MAVVPRIEGFGVVPNERAAFQGLKFVDPGIQQKPLDFSAAADRLDKAQNAFDEARVDDRINSLRKSALDLERGENGFRNLLGENAMTADKQGRGMVDRYDFDLRKVGDGLTKDLTPHQQQLFARKAESIYLSQQASAQQHWLEQSDKYLTGSWTGGIDNAVEMGAQSYDKPDVMADSYKRIEDYAGKLGKHKGWSTEQVSEFVRKNASAMYKRGILVALEASRKDPARATVALGILEANAKHMSSEDVIQCRKLIDGQLDAVKLDEVSTQAADGALFPAQATLVATEAAINSGDAKKVRDATNAVYMTVGLDALTGGGHHIDGNTGKTAVYKRGGEEAKDQWQYGAPSLSVPKAMEAAKSRGVEFDKERFLTDRGYAIALGEQHFSDMSIQYGGDLDKAYAAYVTSKDEVDSAVARATEAGSPGDWLSYLGAEDQKRVVAFNSARDKAERFDVRDRNGNAVNPMTADYASGKLSMTTVTRAQVEERVVMLDPRAAKDPVWKEQVVNAAMRKIEQQKQDYITQQTAVLSAINDLIYQHNGDLNAIPSEQWAQLDRSQQDAARQLAQKVANRDESTNLPLYSRLMTNDDILMGMSYNELKTYRGEISGQYWTKLETRYLELHEQERASNDAAAIASSQGRQGKAVGKNTKLTSSEVKTEIEFVLDSDMKDKLKDDPDWYNVVIAGCQDFIIQATQARGIVAHGNPQVLRELAREYFANQVSVENTFGWGTHKKPLAFVKVGDFPDHSKRDAQSVIKTFAKSYARSIGGEAAGMREPTEREMNEALHKLFILKNPPFEINTRELALDKTLVDHVTKEIKKANGGREPSSIEVIRGYLLARLEGIALDNSDEVSAFYLQGHEATGDNYFGM